MTYDGKAHNASFYFSGGTDLVVGDTVDLGETDKLSGYELRGLRYLVNNTEITGEPQLIGSATEDTVYTIDCIAEPFGNYWALFDSDFGIQTRQEGEDLSLEHYAFIPSYYKESTLEEGYNDGAGKDYHQQAAEEYAEALQLWAQNSRSMGYTYAYYGDTRVTATLTIKALSAADYTVTAENVKAVEKADTVQGITIFGVYADTDEIYVSVTDESGTVLDGWDNTLLTSLNATFTNGSVYIPLAQTTNQKTWTVSYTVSRGYYGTDGTTFTATALPKQGSASFRLVPGGTAVTGKDVTSYADGGAHSIALENTDGAIVTGWWTSADSTVVTEQPTFTEAGTYTIYFTAKRELETDLFETYTGSAVLTLRDVAVTPYSGEYDGQTHNAVTLPADMTGLTVTFNGSAEMPIIKDAGETAIKIEIKDENGVVVSTQNVKAVVAPKMLTFDTSNLGLTGIAKLYDGTRTLPAIKGSLKLAGVLAGDTVNLTWTGTAAALDSLICGSGLQATLTYTGTKVDNTNYTIASEALIPFTVNHFETLDVTPYSGIADGKAHSAVTLPADCDGLTVTYNGEKTMPTVQGGGNTLITVVFTDGAGNIVNTQTVTAKVTPGGFIEYRNDDGTTETVGYTASDAGRSLPTANKRGYTFNGWKINGQLYTALTEALQSAINNSILIAISSFIPATVFTATGDATGTLTNADNTMQYQLPGGEWTNITGDKVELVNVIPGILQVKGNSEAFDSEIQSITISRTAKPAEIGVTPCTTIANNDGTITGVDSTMEYKKSGDTGWTACGGTAVAGLADGTYLVRTKASGTALASEPVELIVSRCLASHQLTGNSLTVSLATSTDAKKVMVAEYNASGKMLSVQMQSVPTNLSCTFTLSGSAATTKYFIVGSSFSPTAPAVTVE